MNTITSLRSTPLTLLPHRLIELLSRVKKRSRWTRASRRVLPVVNHVLPENTSQQLLSASADVAVVRVERPAAAPVILKVAGSATAAKQLQREADILKQLAADATLGEWRKHIATVIDQGEYADQAWVAQSLVAGEHLGPLAGEIATITGAANMAIEPLHTATARPVLADLDVVDRLVHDPIATIVRWRPGVATRLGSIGDDLAANIGTKQLILSRVHGDYSPGNILWTASRRDICGIVDWELSADRLPPEIDRVLFAIAFVSERRRIEWGDLIDEILRSVTGAGEHTALLDAAEGGPNGLDLTTAVLMTWIHHISANIDKSIGFRKNPIWLSQNVDRVVESLQHHQIRVGRG